MLKKIIMGLGCLSIMLAGSVIASTAGETASIEKQFEGYVYDFLANGLDKQNEADNFEKFLNDNGSALAKAAYYEPDGTPYDDFRVLCQASINSLDVRIDGNEIDWKKAADRKSPEHPYWLVFKQDLVTMREELRVY